MKLDAEALRLRIERIDEMAHDVAIGILAHETVGSPVPVMAPEVLVALNATADKLRASALPEANPNVRPPN